MYVQRMAVYLTGGRVIHLRVKSKLGHNNNDTITMKQQCQQHNALLYVYVQFMDIYLTGVRVICLFVKPNDNNTMTLKHKDSDTKTMTQ